MTLRSSRAIAYGMIAACTVLVALTLFVIIRKAWPTDKTRIGDVIAYRVAGDTAFLVWRVDEPHWKSSGWLSRVDASGKTLWVRRLPDYPLAQDSIHVGHGIVAVRYSHRGASGIDGDHSLVAFTFEGKQLWDHVLAPYHAKQLGDRIGGTTSAEVGIHGGAATDDSFIEWVDSETEQHEVNVSASNGRPVWNHVIDGFPQSVRILGSRLLSTEAVAAPPRTLGLRTTDLKTGAPRQVLIRGNGCVDGSAYLAVVDQDTTPALVSFERGDADSVRVIAKPFEPLGAQQDFIVEACGRYGHELVFVLEQPRRSEASNVGRRLVITNEAGILVRGLDLEFDVLSWLDTNDPVSTRFPDQAPFMGEMPRFVPVLQPHGTGDELAVIDLQNAVVKSRIPSDMRPWRTLFRDGHEWFFGGTKLDRSLHLEVFNGDTGEQGGSVMVSGAESRYGLDSPLLPSHVSNGRVWVVLYGEAPLTDPPLAVLDAITLHPQHVSRRLLITDGL